MENNLILVSHNLSAYQVDIQKIETCIRFVLKILDLQAFSISISFCGNTKIQSLNRDFRNKDKPTDVLSFPQNNWKKPLFASRKNRVGSKIHGRQKIDYSLGDIIISLEQAQKNARKINQGLDREVVFLMVHSILHLCGHDHETVKDELVMLREQRFIMSKLDRKKFWLSCVKKKPGRKNG